MEFESSLFIVQFDISLWNRGWNNIFEIEAGINERIIVSQGAKSITFHIEN